MPPAFVSRMTATLGLAILTALIAICTGAKLPNTRSNAIEQNPDVDSARRTGARGSIRSRDWVKISQAPPTVVNTALGDRIELECEVIGSPTPSIQWLKERSPIQETLQREGMINRGYGFENNNILRPAEKGLAKVRSRLIVDCVLPQHEGLYTCLASAGRETTLAPATMILLQGNINNITALLSACPSPSVHRDSPARITEWSPVYMENIGSDVTLPCRAEGNPRPSIYWLDAENRLISDSEPRYKVLPNGDLLIYKLRWSDMGGYVCVASNSRNRDTTNTFLYPVLPE